MEIKSSKELEEYLDSKVNVDSNPNDNIFLYQHFLRYEKNVEYRIVENIYNSEYIEEYIQDMYSIGWKHPEDLIDSAKKSNLGRYWKHEDYRVYVLAQMQLYYQGLHSASKTAHILNISHQDVLRLAEKLDKLY
jgi:hypothetical protein